MHVQESREVLKFRAFFLACTLTNHVVCHLQAPFLSLFLTYSSASDAQAF